MFARMTAFLRDRLVPRLFPVIAEEERDYLNKAASCGELQRRQREVESGLFRDQYFYM